MHISRLIAAAPRTTELTAELSKLNGPCVGCTDCSGLCKELIDALLLPELVLSRKHAAQ